MQPDELVQILARDEQSGLIEPLDIDPIGNGLRVIDQPHAEIHTGRTFAASEEIDTTSSSGGTFDILIRTPGTEIVHMGLWAFDVTATPGKVRMHEGVAFDAEGTDINPHNMNRVVADHEDFQTDVSATKNPTSVDVSNAEDLEVKKITGGKHSGGEDSSPLIEWMLKPSTPYILRYTNEHASDSAEGTFTLRWYELTTDVHI